MYSIIHDFPFILFNLKITPSSKKTMIKSISYKNICIDVKSDAENNKANDEVKSVINTILNINDEDKLFIVKGNKSPHKLIKIHIKQLEKTIIDYLNNGMFDDKISDTQCFKNKFNNKENLFKKNEEEFILESLYAIIEEQCNIKL